jgi:hypothetical protein
MRDAAGRGWPRRAISLSIFDLCFEQGRAMGKKSGAGGQKCGGRGEAGPKSGRKTRES